MIRPFTFRARLADIWDGDTLYLDIDRGESLWSHRSKYRLYGVDTPEIRGASDEEEAWGRDATEFVNTMLQDQDLIVSTMKGKSKYDWMVEIWLHEDQPSLSEAIITYGHGVPYFGGTKLSWPERKAMQQQARDALK